MGMSHIPLILLPPPSAALLPHVPYSILSQESSLLSQECLETVSTPVPHSSLPPVLFQHHVPILITPTFTTGSYNLWRTWIEIISLSKLSSLLKSCVSDFN